MLIKSKKEKKKNEKENINTMVYTIDYIKNNKTYVLYDIDCFLELHEDYCDKTTNDVYDAWRTELHHTCFGESVAQYVYDNIHDEETLETFKKDCNYMSWLRGYLHENHKNYWLKQDEANKFYDQFNNKLDKIINAFAEKWNLIVKK